MTTNHYQRYTRAEEALLSERWHSKPDEMEVPEFDAVMAKELNREPAAITQKRSYLKLVKFQKGKNRMPKEKPSEIDWKYAIEVIEKLDDGQRVMVLKMLSVLYPQAGE